MTGIQSAAWLIVAVTLFLLAVAGYALLVHVYPQYYWAQIDSAVPVDGRVDMRPVVLRGHVDEQGITGYGQQEQCDCGYEPGG